jgi:biotin synthase
VRQAGITVCSGGIIGMGESINDRCAMLVTLANLDPHPESVPINALVPVEGTPLAGGAGRSAGAGAHDRRPRGHHAALEGAAVGRRLALSREAQVLCFLAGANSIFYGEKLLTTGNPDVGRGSGAAARCGPAAGGRRVESQYEYETYTK